MSNMPYALSVALAPGDGLIGRRDQTLLYIPEPDERAKVLIDAFSHGPIEETWVRLAETVVDREFDVCAFCCLTAGDQIEIRVFGSLELNTDLRSVPMLSGAASGTWVEHRVHGHPHSAAITTGNEAVDERTGLGDGIVHAGGFTAVFADQQPTIDDTAVIPLDEPAISISTEVPAADLPESDLLSYVRGLTEEASTEVEEVESPADRTLDPAAAEQELSSGTPMLAARVCKSGHVNAPSRANCEVCEIFLPAGPEGVSFVPRPSLGTLAFDDGRTVELTSDVMIGRNPTRNGDHWIPVIIDGDRLSRTHLTVRCNAWEVMLEDAGSHNGTVVISSEGSQPVALVAGTPHLIEPGATAYFGSSSFRFEARQS